jgi:hypothetical protein
MQDAPLHEWMGYDARSGYRKEYLLEDLRLEGRNSAANEPYACGESDANSLKERLYRCEDCFGLEMTCAACCMVSHQQSPLHIIRVRKRVQTYCCYLPCFRNGMGHHLNEAA